MVYKDRTRNIITKGESKVVGRDIAKGMDIKTHGQQIMNHINAIDAVFIHKTMNIHLIIRIVMKN